MKNKKKIRRTNVLKGNARKWNRKKGLKKPMRNKTIFFFFENAANDKKHLIGLVFDSFWFFFTEFIPFFWEDFEGEVKLYYLYAYRSVCSNLFLFVVVVLI